MLRTEKSPADRASKPTHDRQCGSVSSLRLAQVGTVARPRQRARRRPRRRPWVKPSALICPVRRERSANALDPHGADGFTLPLIFVAWAMWVAHDVLSWANRSNGRRRLPTPLAAGRGAPGESGQRSKGLKVEKCGKSGTGTAWPPHTAPDTPGQGSAGPFALS
jgi:hypothetical protein